MRYWVEVMLDVDALEALADGEVPDHLREQFAQAFGKASETVARLERADWEREMRALTGL